MLPNGRELVWFGLGVVTVLFVWPWLQRAMKPQGS